MVRGTGQRGTDLRKGVSWQLTPLKLERSHVGLMIPPLSTIIVTWKPPPKPAPDRRRSPLSIEQPFNTTTMSEEEVNMTAVHDDTDLTELVGPSKTYQKLVENCVTNKDCGNVTWRDAQALTLAAFLNDFSHRVPTIRARLLGWIKLYSLEDRFKKDEVPKQDGLHKSYPQIAKGLDARISAISPPHDNPWLIVFEEEKKRTKAIEHNAGDGAVMVQGKNRGCIATCSVTGCRGFDPEVVAAHVLPLGDSSGYLEGLFVIKNLNILRNIVLLCKNIEMAFNGLQLCFLQGNSAGEYQLKIWDRKGLEAMTLFDYHDRNEDNTVTLRNGEVFDNQGGESKRLISAYDGCRFCFPEGKHPLSQILSHHAQVSYKWALKNNGSQATKSVLHKCTALPSMTICLNATPWLVHSGVVIHRQLLRLLYLLVGGNFPPTLPTWQRNKLRPVSKTIAANAKIGVALSIGAARSVQRS
eukprot:scaffold77824_cov56-Attheya_sp.AAC.4